MNRLKKKLQELKKIGVIHSFELKEQIPTCDGDTKSRLIDTLFIRFPGGEELNIGTCCSGCLENSSLLCMDDESD